MARAGNDIYYEIHGHGGGFPVVLIMGLAMDSGGWAKQLPALSARRRAVLLDNRGVGRSKKPAGPYTTAEMAADELQGRELLEDAAHDQPRERETIVGRPANA